MHSVIDALLAVNVAEIPVGTTARLNCGGEGYYSTTTTTPPNRALFQGQFIVIPDALFISEHPEDSHYSARRISEHLGWSRKEWSFPLPIYRASFKGQWLVWKPGLAGPNRSLNTLEEENCKYYTMIVVLMLGESWRKVSEKICIEPFQRYSITCLALATVNTSPFLWHHITVLLFIMNIWLIHSRYVCLVSIKFSWRVEWSR